MNFPDVYHIIKNGIPEYIRDVLRMQVRENPNVNGPVHINIHKPSFIGFCVYDKLTIEETEITYRISTGECAITIWKDYPKDWHFCVFEKH